MSGIKHFLKDLEEYSEDLYEFEQFHNLGILNEEEIDEFLHSAPIE